MDTISCSFCQRLPKVWGLFLQLSAAEPQLPFLFDLQPCTCKHIHMAQQKGFCDLDRGNRRPHLLCAVFVCVTSPPRLQPINGAHTQINAAFEHFQKDWKQFFLVTSTQWKAHLLSHYAVLLPLGKYVFQKKHWQVAHLHCRSAHLTSSCAVLSCHHSCLSVRTVFFHFILQASDQMACFGVNMDDCFENALLTDGWEICNSKKINPSVNKGPKPFISFLCFLWGPTLKILKYTF